VQTNCDFFFFRGNGCCEWQFNQQFVLMWNLNLALIKWFLLFWVSHRVFIVSQAPLINKKVQGERLFKCHHLDQSSWVTNQKQSFCFMGSCENQCLNMWTHFHTLWKCGWWYFIQSTLDKAIFPYAYRPALRTHCQSVSFLWQILSCFWLKCWKLK
jgi:hypothetical protein